MTGERGNPDDEVKHMLSRCVFRTLGDAEKALERLDVFAGALCGCVLE